MFIIRDLLGSLLFIVLQKDNIMIETLKYLVTPVVLALSYAHVKMQKSPNSVLMKYLESELTSLPPSSFNAIIDAELFLH